MPLIQSNAGGFVLVCLNGCVPPNLTKGFDVLTKYPGNWMQYPGAAAVAPGLNQQLAPQTPTPIQTTMRAIEGARGVVAVTFPETGERLPGHPNARRWTLQEWVSHRQPEFSVTGGTPVLLYVCTVCGYTEMYHADTVDRANAPKGG